MWLVIIGYEMSVYEWFLVGLSWVELFTDVSQMIWNFDLCVRSGIVLIIHHTHTIRCKSFPFLPENLNEKDVVMLHI